MTARPSWHARWRSEARFLMGSVRRGLRGRDLALIAAGLTFYAGISVVPLLLLALALTSLLAGADWVRGKLDLLGGVPVLVLVVLRALLRQATVLRTDLEAVI